MSVSTEVQRTLVKSPPELWAELSNPEALSRHLGGFGEVKITSVEPETKVEWEAEETSGIVHLKQSGWGTKVTLSVTRNAPTPDEPVEPMAVAEPVAVAEPEPTPEQEPAVPTESETAPEANPPSAESEMVSTDPEIEAEPVATTEAEPVATAVSGAVVERGPKPGFFARLRLFRKHKTKPATVAAPEVGPTASVEPEVTPEPDAEPEVVAMAAPEPIYPEPPPEPVADLAAELASVEAQMTEETTELLTGVLDRLGAAHHRPFSRG